MSSTSVCVCVFVVPPFRFRSHFACEVNATAERNSCLTRARMLEHRSARSTSRPQNMNEVTKKVLCTMLPFNAASFCPFFLQHRVPGYGSTLLFDVLSFASRHITRARAGCRQIIKFLATSVLKVVLLFCCCPVLDLFLALPLSLPSFPCTVCLSLRRWLAAHPFEACRVKKTFAVGFGSVL